MIKSNSLYIHIPFCSSICFYCDFPKILTKTNFVDDYLDALLIELKKQKINHQLKTIYIGGGTPTSVNLTKLFVKLKKYCNAKTEYTIEGNVVDLNEEKLKAYRSYGINRLSLGIQSTNNRILKVLGRKHTKDDVTKKVKLAKKYFNNINLDLIYGFKELSNRELTQTLNDLVKLNPTHISTYSLEINPGTLFYNQHKEALDSSLVREQFDLIYEFLKRHGYVRYEISNFAKKGYESKHNLNYWLDNEYYGIGLGAASYLNNYRYKNTLNIKEYINHQFVKEKELISKNDDKKYYIMLNLRTKYGISLKDYAKRFHENLLIKKKATIENLKNRNLLKINYNKLVVTYEGSMLLDIILKELF